MAAVGSDAGKNELASVAPEGVSWGTWDFQIPALGTRMGPSWMEAEPDKAYIAGWALFPGIYMVKLRWVATKLSTRRIDILIIF